MTDYRGSSGGFWIGLLIGGAAVYAWAHHNVPTYAANAAIHDEPGMGTYTYVLEKLGSGQVAIIHGFIDDYEVCSDLAKMLQARGGVYYCTPAISVHPIK